MSIFKCLSEKSWLLISFYISLAGIAQAGAMNETGSGSQGTAGTSQGAAGNMGSLQGMGKIQSFQGADRNSDNYVTKNELNDFPSLLKHFDRADANKDGKLEENEYKNLIMENAQ